MLATLADYLGWETENGRLRVDDPQLAAEQFVGMLAGRLQLRAVLDVGPAPDADELARRAAYAVSCFLAIYGPAQSDGRSEEHTSELQSLMRISYADFCLKKKKTHIKHNVHTQQQTNKQTQYNEKTHT